MHGHEEADSESPECWHLDRRLVPLLLARAHCRGWTQLLDPADHEDEDEEQVVAARSISVHLFSGERMFILAGEVTLPAPIKRNHAAAHHEQKLDERIISANGTRQESPHMSSTNQEPRSAPVTAGVHISHVWECALPSALALAYPTPADQPAAASHTPARASTSAAAGLSRAAGVTVRAPVLLLCAFPSVSVSVSASAVWLSWQVSDEDAARDAKAEADRAAHDAGQRHLFHQREQLTASEQRTSPRQNHNDDSLAGQDWRYLSHTQPQRRPTSLSAVSSRPRDPHALSPIPVSFFVPLTGGPATSTDVSTGVSAARSLAVDPLAGTNLPLPTSHAPSPRSHQGTALTADSSSTAPHSLSPSCRVRLSSFNDPDAYYHTLPSLAHGHPALMQYLSRSSTSMGVGVSPRMQLTPTSTRSMARPLATPERHGHAPVSPLAHGPTIGPSSMPHTVGTSHLHPLSAATSRSAEHASPRELPNASTSLLPRIISANAVSGATHGQSAMTVEELNLAPLVRPESKGRSHASESARELRLEADAEPTMPMFHEDADA